MFGFEKKEEKGKGLELKVVFDMELLDRAMNAAIKDFEGVCEKHLKAMEDEKSEAKKIFELQRIMLDTFSEKTKQFITELSEKE